MAAGVALSRIALPSGLEAIALQTMMVPLRNPVQRQLMQSQVDCTFFVSLASLRSLSLQNSRMCPFCGLTARILTLLPHHVGEDYAGDCHSQAGDGYPALDSKSRRMCCGSRPVAE